MKNPKRLLIFLAVAISIPVAANGVTFTPGVGVGFNSMRFTAVSGAVDSAVFKVVDLSIAASGKRSFARLNADIPFGNAYSVSSGRAYGREDYTLTAGYFLTPTVSLFGGYSMGTTWITDITKGVIEHDDQGPFAGASTSLSVGRSGSVNLSVAYASMNGSRTLGYTSAYDSGSTTGYSEAVTWSDTYRGKSSYYVSLRAKQYKSSLSGTSPPFTIDKFFITLMVGLLFPG